MNHRIIFKCTCLAIVHIIALHVVCLLVGWLVAHISQYTSVLPLEPGCIKILQGEKNKHGEHHPHQSVTQLWRRARTILGIVRVVNATKQHLDQPQLGRQVHRWVGLHHLVGLELVIAGAVDQSADLGMVVNLFQELASLDVIADLGNLQRQRIGAVSGARQLAVGVDDGLEEGVAAAIQPFGRLVMLEKGEVEKLRTLLQLGIHQ